MKNHVVLTVVVDGVNGLQSPTVNRILDAIEAKGGLVIHGELKEETKGVGPSSGVLTALRDLKLGYVGQSVEKIAGDKVGVACVVLYVGVLLAPAFAVPRIAVPRIFVSIDDEGLYIWGTDEFTLDDTVEDVGQMQEVVKAAVGEAEHSGKIARRK